MGVLIIKNKNGFKPEWWRASFEVEIIWPNDRNRWELKLPCESVSNDRETKLVFIAN